MPRQLSSPAEEDYGRLKALLLLGVGLIFLVKLALALQLDLYSDEIFYWKASTYPALAYSDLPFVTAQLAGAGAWLLGNSPVAVRLLFLLLGSALPFLVYWVARAVVPPIQALQAAVLALCLPLGAFAGLLAVPDVPLLFIGLLAIGLFVRVIHTNAMVLWLALGVTVALGFATHYRFFPYPLAALLCLGLVPSLRPLWRQPGLWFAGFISLVGLYPIVSFNLGNDLSGLGYHLFNRHPWEFQAAGLLHLPTQALLVTPLLYGVMLLTLWQLYRGSRAGDTHQTIFLGFAATNLLLYLLLSPWTDSTRTSIHWPLSGYFLLLVYVPRTLRDLHDRLVSVRGTAFARQLTLSVPALGFTGSLVALAVIGSQGFQNQLQPLTGPGILSNKMAGWQEFAAMTESVLEREFAESTTVVTDNYYTAAQAEFAAPALKTYTIDNDKAVRDGRMAQYLLWKEDFSALSAVTLEHALFITEDSALTIPDKQNVLERICGIARSVKFLRQLILFDGDKRFSYYRVDHVGGGSGNDSPASLCPYPSQGWIDTPQHNDRVVGPLRIAGWVFNEDIGVDSVNILIDGEVFAKADYGTPRPDVVEVLNITTDPNRPDLGFEYLLDSTVLPNGEYALALEIINAAGEVQETGHRMLEIAN
ncbi:MAG: glycosyltransferase family 39 protein [Pseudohongiellaceae bacterium]